MSRIKVSRVVAAVWVALATGIGAKAQDGAYSAYSPYTVYGIGDISQQGTAFNKSMGGVGIATRNRAYINYLNPAAVTARDTLSFMADVGLSMQNKLFRQGDIKSANNTFNIYDFAFSFPIYKKSAMVFGITPFSDVGYDFSHRVDDPLIVGQTGNITYSSYGDGSLYQLFGGIGATFWDRFSVGAQLLYYFGNLDKNTQMTFASSSYRNLYSTYKFQLHALTGKFGLQYEQPLSGGYYVTAGATYRMGTSMRGYVSEARYATVSNVADTLGSRRDTLSRGSVKLAAEAGLGVSLRRGDKWSAEINYLRTDWSRSGFDSAFGFSSVGAAAFSSTCSESLRAGFSYTPNRNDIRYFWRRCTYRGGVYYDKAYYKYDGHAVNSYGLTFGITLPIKGYLHNGITLGADLGQKGRLQGEMTRERYALFVVGFNIHDIWFTKFQYD